MFAAGTLAAAAVGTAAVVLHSWQAVRTHPSTGPVGSTLARIAAESRNPETSPPAVRAAPVAQHSLPDSGTGGEQVSARLPEGYSFVGFHGEMAKAGLGVRTDAAQAQDGPDWLGGPEAAETLAAQARAHRREWTFGWIRLAPGAREGDLAPQLASAGAAIVGSSGRLLRARLPGDEAGLAAIARLPAVDALGAMPVEARLRAFDRHQPPNHEPLPVFVTLMEADPNGRWRRELAALGAVVGRYDPDLRVYEASVVRSVLDVLGATDFVLAVEPVGTVEAAHDTAVPAMGADALRAWEGSAGIFSGVGGASVPIAVMDTGLNVRHPDISSNRSSICGANFVYFDPLVDDDDLWVDAGGHGTHVTGTIVGNGAVLPRYAGMAPRVQHVRFAKVLSHEGRGTTIFVRRGMDFLGRSSACPDAGWSSDAVKPLVVNMSLSSVSLDWEGRTVDERKLDSVVWDRRQLYVVSAANSGNRGFSEYAAAKNSLAVGAALDSGSLAEFSSHGPTADGRLAPQIVGTGVDVHSAAGDGSREGYRKYSGTSMASPAVAGLAALLMDAVPAHRERPALTRARLMASAIRPDVWLEDPAEEIAPGDSSQPVDIDRDATVEPGEPVGSGIRTKWWAWTASADGTWVWRIDELTRPFNRLMMSVFAGDSLDDLELVATNGERMAIDLDFRAEGARRYWVSAGFPAADLGAYEFPSASATLVWGTAPKNDDAAEAVAISGARGSVAGSNAFATSAHGERRVDVGRQTVWYAFEAPASGWFRFAAAGDGGPWALTVYRDAADGAGLETVASGDEGGTAVRFETAAGVRHLIALGVRGGGRGGEFTLQWELLDPSPVRYVGRLADGDRDSRDNWVAISSPRGLAMHPDGNALYLLTGSGLQIFERDRRTGRLDHAHLLETDNSGCAIAAWDARRQRLLVDDWGLHAFASVGAGPELLELGRVHPGDCANAMLIDSTGSDLYRISRSGYTLEHFVLDPDGAIRRVADHDLLAEFTPHKETAAAVLSNDGRHLYAAAADILQVFERDPESGELARVDTQVRIDDLGHRLFLPLAIADDDGHLFVGEGRSAVAVFSLEDPLNPRRLGASERSGGRYCSLADVRAESPTADVFCNTFGFSVRWDSQDGELESTDWFLPSASEALLFHEVRGLAVSPDKRHLYVSAFPPTWEGGSIAIFARPRYCRDGDEVESGTGCGIHDTPLHFAVDADSTGCLRGSGTELCEDAAHEQRDAEIAGVALTFVAVKNEDGSWTIKDVEPDSGAPDLVVDAPAVDSNPEPGASFSLSVVVRNGGMAEAPTAELRYYRSDNARISAADAEVGAGAVEALAAGGDIDTSIELTAPSTPGTYFYGACVDRVPGEFATGNNCSYGVSVVDVDTPDDHGDRPADATPVAVPSATAGDLGTVGDRDYFRVEIAETTTLTIETTGDTDTFGTLFDGDGATSLGTDDDGGAQRNFRIERNLTAGTYYVQVRGFSAKTTGPYTLNVDGD